MRRTATIIAALLSLSAAAHADSATADAAGAETAPATQAVSFEPLATPTAADEDTAVSRRDGSMVFESIDLAGKVQYPAIDILLGSPNLDLQVKPREEKTFACKIPSTLRSSSL